jgi:pimeloyl-ACP methyl ester carboxylesterase
MPFYFFLLGGLFLLFLIGALFAILKIGPLVILQPPRVTVEDYRRCTNILLPAHLQLSYEDVSVHTTDGIKLVGWLVWANSVPRGTVIYLHGVGDNRISGLGLAKLLAAHGYNTCLFDSRRHGESEGRFCTYGYYEKEDVREIITKLKGAFGPKLGNVGLFGVSMGGAVAIQAAAIDARIAAVIAEGCFLDLRSISLDHQKRIIKVRWKFIHGLVMKRAERIARFKADDVSPRAALEAIHIPILFVHGSRDSVIDAQHSEILYRHAKGPKELYLIRDAYHNNTWTVGGKEYEEKILTFFDRWLSPTSSTSN